MFGSLGAFVNGTCSPAVRHRHRGQARRGGARSSRAVEGSGPFGPEERPMGGYLSLRPSYDDAQASAWVDRARDHVATLPPKVKKPKK